MSYPTGARVDLRASARKEATTLVLSGVAALVIGPIVLLLGSVLLVGLILGPILILGGLVVIPFGIYRALVPMHHPAMRALGATNEEREATLAIVEAELASAMVRRVSMSSGATLAVTPRFFVAHGPVLVIARREDLLWGYGKVTTRKRYGITTGKTNEVCLVTRRTGEHLFATKGEQETAGALALFREGSSRALVGYRDDWKALSTLALAQTVDRVAYVPAAFDPSALPLPPQGPPAPVPESTVLPWTLLVGGTLITGAGVLLSMFFGWIATHPHEPDDVRFGGFFSVACIFVCSGPGVLAVGFAVWRLFLRNRL